MFPNYFERIIDLPSIAFQTEQTGLKNVSQTEDSVQNSDCDLIKTILILSLKKRQFVFIVSQQTETCQVFFFLLALFCFDPPPPHHQYFF